MSLTKSSLDLTFALGGTSNGSDHLETLQIERINIKSTETDPEEDIPVYNVIHRHFPNA